MAGCYSDLRLIIDLGTRYSSSKVLDSHALPVKPRPKLLTLILKPDTQDNNEGRGP